MDRLWAGFLLLCTVLIAACAEKAPVEQKHQETTAANTIVPADRFAYPLSRKETITQAKDRDEWYNAQDFGENDHLGEDWNKNTGGNTDCGEPVYSIANGRIAFAGNAGPGWGSVVIIEHLLPNGEKIESLYGHLQQVLVREGDVNFRQQIGTVGNANGRYPCHLHLVIRTQNCPMWGQAGPGYSSDRNGWIDPSNFIDEERKM